MKNRKEGTGFRWPGFVYLKVTLVWFLMVVSALQDTLVDIE